MTGPRELPGRAAGPAGSRSLGVLTFEAGDFVLGIPSTEVDRLSSALPEGATVVDAVGLLPRQEGGGGVERRRGCYVLLAGGGPGGERVALTASRAGDVRIVEPGRLLPLPGFLFPRENPFMGLIPPGEGGRRRPVFVVAGPERLVACAGAR